MEDFDDFLESDAFFYFCLIECTKVGALTWAGDGGVGEEVTSVLTPSSGFSFVKQSPIRTYMMQIERRDEITDAVPGRTGVGIIVIKRLT